MVLWNVEINAETFERVLNETDENRL